MSPAMSARARAVARASVLTLALGLIATLIPVTAQAQETVTATGETDYEALPPGDVVESVVVNVITLEFPLAGGPFEGSARLELVHDVPERGCQFQSTHSWEISGDFDAETGQFSGTWVEVEDVTTGACENFSFVRDFNPDEDEFSAGLIAQLGRITGRVSPAQFTLEVDPSLFATDEPGDGEITTTPDDTTDPTDTAQPDQPEQPPDDSPPPITTEPEEAGFPWLPVLIVLGLLGAAVPFVRGRLPGAGSPEPEDADKDCSELERQWRQARDDCDQARKRSADLSDRFDEVDERLTEATNERAGLPSEETRVELPDGTRLSQLDLALRRAAAQEAWDAYLANPTPESAAAAERAWQEQATPEWLEEQRRAHEAERQRLDEAVEAARADKEQVGRDLADARTKEQEACARAAEARRKLDECLVQAAAAASPPPAAPAPTPAPVGGAGPAPPVPAPPTGGAPQPGEPQEEEPGPCTDGDERWIDIDGPHPFTIGTDEVVAISLVLISGTRRGVQLGSLNQTDFVNLDQNGRATGIPFSLFVALSPAEIRSAFSGQGGLAEVWQAAGSGAVQQLSLTLSYGKRSVMATCERKEVCVNGTWQPQTTWRPRLSGDVETVSDAITVEGNIEAGLAVTEESYLDQLVAFFQRVQGQVRLLMSAKETYDQYQKDCRSGRR